MDEYIKEYIKIKESCQEIIEASMLLKDKDTSYLYTYMFTQCQLILGQKIESLEKGKLFMPGEYHNLCKRGCQIILNKAFKAMKEEPDAFVANVVMVTSATIIIIECREIPLSSNQPILASLSG